MDVKGPVKTKAIEITPERAEVINSFLGVDVFSRRDIGDSFSMTMPGLLEGPYSYIGCCGHNKVIFKDGVRMACRDAELLDEENFHKDCFTDGVYAYNLSCKKFSTNEYRAIDERNGTILMGALYGFENLNLDYAPDADMLIEAINLRQALNVEE